MRQKIRTTARAKQAAPHPHSVATISPQIEVEELPDQPFAEGLQNELDPDLRHRLISEAAFSRQAERGYDESYERDDWLDAQAEVDHVVIRPKPG